MNDTEQDSDVLQSNAATTVELGRADELLEWLIDEALLESFQPVTHPAGFWVVNRRNAAPHQRNLRRKMIQLRLTQELENNIGNLLTSRAWYRCFKFGQP